MRLFEVKARNKGELPARAGYARLFWDDTERGVPTRKDNEITLPSNRQTQFFPLKEGEQFLLECTVAGNIAVTNVWFGGTDENPFLVRLQPELLQAFEGGEEAFFNALKPPSVHTLEQQLKVEAIRQGDWFAVPYPKKFSWNDIVGVYSATYLTAAVKTQEDGTPLLNTRHSLHAGRLAELHTFSHRAYIGEGLLRAPDHADRRLVGPHYLCQAVGLASPSEAD